MSNETKINQIRKSGIQPPKHVLISGCDRGGPGHQRSRQTAGRPGPPHRRPLSAVRHQERPSRLPAAHRPLHPPAQHHQQGEGGRALCHRGVHRLRAGLRLVVDSGGAESHERGRAHCEGLLCGESDVPPSAYRCVPGGKWRTAGKQSASGCGVAHEDAGEVAASAPRAAGGVSRANQARSAAGPDEPYACAG